MRFLSLLLALVMPLAACGGDGATATDAGAWVGEVSTEGNVTMVRNQAGSRWGGPAILEPEVSIGVDEGAPEYMFGSISGLWATDDEIYVVDSQVPVVRVYDSQGRHLRDIGREGQGPGEFQRPSGVLVDPDGRVYVREGGGDPRINVYSHEGEPLETWRWTTGQVRVSGGQLVMRNDGAIFTLAIKYPQDVRPTLENRVRGMQQVGRDGAVGELIEQPDLQVDTPTVSSERMTTSVPFSPGQITTFTPAGAYVAGDSSTYGFEIHYPDGRVVEVERYWTPVPISTAEKEYAKRRLTASMRRFNDDPEWTYDGPPLPDHKPAYYLFNPTQGNRVLVVRYGPSHLVDGCDVNFDLNEGPGEECFEPERVWDMFDLEGVYLGEVVRPTSGRLFQPFWRDDMVVMVVEDEFGTNTVKRFRFRLPDEASR
jgi:hypothetical protein